MQSYPIPSSKVHNVRESFRQQQGQQTTSSTTTIQPGQIIIAQPQQGQITPVTMQVGEGQQVQIVQAQPQGQAQQTQSGTGQTMQVMQQIITNTGEIQQIPVSLSSLSPAGWVSSVHGVSIPITHPALFAVSYLLCFSPGSALPVLELPSVPLLHLLRETVLAVALAYYHHHHLCHQGQLYKAV